MTERTEGKVSMTGSLKVSDDGKTLAMNGKRTKPDGGTSDESLTMTRVSGGPGLAGKWKTKNMNSSSPEMLEITPQAACLEPHDRIGQRVEARVAAEGSHGDIESLETAGRAGQGLRDNIVQELPAARARVEGRARQQPR